MKLLALAAVTAMAEPAGEDAKLAAFYRSYLDDDFRRHPYTATRAGDHTYDDRLDDLSPQARADDRSFVERTLAELPNRVEYAKLSRAGQLDYEILRHSLRYAVWQDDYLKPYEI